MFISITVCLVKEAGSGPFVLHGDLETCCRQAAELGFEAIELFPPSADALDARQLNRALDRHGLKLSAVGTGGGWVVRKLSLTAAEPETRRQARDFIAALVDLAGGFGAPAIVGSMQGRWQGAVTRPRALAWLGEALEQLAPRAHAHGVPLLFEPLNRYETNLLNSIAQTIKFLETLRTRNVRILGDLFHMNIEEADLAQSIRQAGKHLGYIHFADSNRRAIGFGHTEVKPIRQALTEIGYDGVLSAEILPLPDPAAAARQTRRAWETHFGSSDR